MKYGRASNEPNADWIDYQSYGMRAGNPMNREDLLKLIPLYIAGSLGKEEKELVEKELAISQDLREDVRFWRNAQSAARSASEMHPDSEIIVAFAGGFAADADRRIIEAHLDSCADCRSDVQILREIYERLPATPETGRTGVRTPTQQIRSSARQVEFQHAFRSRRVVYAIPVLALVILLIFLLRPSSETPVPHEHHQSMSLAYQITLRDPGHETVTPVLSLSPDATHVDFSVQIPRSGLDSVLYSIVLTRPGGSLTERHDSLTAISGPGSIDTVIFTANRQNLLPLESPYDLLVAEILPAMFRDLTPEEYRYQFLVADSIRQNR